MARPLHLFVAAISILSPILGTCGAAAAAPASAAATIEVNQAATVAVPPEIRFPDGPPVYAVIKVNTPPTIDGKLDDDCWKAAQPMGRLYMDTGDGPLPSETIVRMVRDDTYLYVAVDCRHPNIADVPVRKGRRDAVSWAGETIELFLHANRNQPDYVQVIFDMSGAFTDMLWGRPQWDGDITAATDVGGTGWRLEARLRMADLAGGGKIDPFLWGANIARNTADDSGSWARLVGSYQQPERFGLLTFCKGDIAVDDVSIGVFGPAAEGASRIPVNLRLRNLGDKGVTAITTFVPQRTPAEGVQFPTIHRTVRPQAAEVLSGYIMAATAESVRVQVSIEPATEPIFEVQLPIRRMPTAMDSHTLDALVYAIRPVSSVVTSKEQASVYLLAQALTIDRQQHVGQLRLIRTDDGQVIWQSPVLLNVPGLQPASQRIDLPVQILKSGRYSVEWAPARDSGMAAVRANIEYSPISLAELQDLCRTVRAQDVLAKLNCPLPKDAADLALVQVRIDRLVDRLELQTAQKQASITAKSLGAYRELMQIVGALRTGRPYSSAQRGWFETAFFSPVDGSAQPFSVYVPADYDKDPSKRYPLAVHLHGAGGSHTRDMGLDSDITGALVLNVFARGRFYGYGPISADEVIRVIREVMNRYRVDADAVHLRGQSMGGHGCFLIAATYPDMFATARPYCGAGYGMLLEQMISLPTFVHHGLADNTVSARGSSFAVAQMQGFGCPVQLYLYPQVGHGVGGAADKIARWDTFKDIRRDSQPQTVVLAPGGIPALKKAYWLSILRYTDIHQEARVRATFVGQNHLVLDTDNVSWLKIELPGKWVDPQKPLQISDVQGLNWAQVAVGDAKALYVHMTGQKMDALTETPVNFADPTVYTGGGVSNMFWLGRPVRVVYGTAGSADQATAMEKLVLGFGRWPIFGRSDMDAGRLPVLKDADIDEQTLKTCDLVLLGTPEDNSLLAKMADHLPIKYIDGKVTVQTDPAMSWPEGEVAFSLYYRNPLAPQQRIWWFGGVEDRKTIQALATATRYGNLGPLSAELTVVNKASAQVVATADLSTDWKLSRAMPQIPLASVWATPADLARQLNRALQTSLPVDISLVDPFYSADLFAWDRLTAGEILRTLPVGDMMIASISGTELLRWREGLVRKAKDDGKAADIPWAGVDPDDLKPEAVYDVLLRPDAVTAGTLEQSGISLTSARVLPASEFRAAKDRFLRTKGLLPPRVPTTQPAQASVGRT